MIGRQSTTRRYPNRSNPQCILPLRNRYPNVCNRCSSSNVLPVSTANWVSGLGINDILGAKAKVAEKTTLQRISPPAVKMEKTLLQPPTSVKSAKNWPDRSWPLPTTDGWWQCCACYDSCNPWIHETLCSCGKLKCDECMYAFMFGTVLHN